MSSYIPRVTIKSAHLKPPGHWYLVYIESPHGTLHSFFFFSNYALIKAQRFLYQNVSNDPINNN